MKGAKAKKDVVATPKKDSKELSKKAEETNLKRKKSAPKEEKATKRQVRKDRKAKKDPNKPKRPPSAFFVFLEEFRKTYKSDNPNVKAVAVIGKAGGDKWKSMSDAEKAPYIAKAEKRKAEYDRNIQAYQQKDKLADEGTGEVSDKSKSEINDDEDEESVEEEDDD
eukprot:c24908_g1_i3 orf=741-1238(-)